MKLDVNLHDMYISPTAGKLFWDIYLPTTSIVTFAVIMNNVFTTLVVAVCIASFVYIMWTGR